MGQLCNDLHYIAECENILSFNLNEGLLINIADSNISNNGYSGYPASLLINVRLAIV